MTPDQAYARAFPIIWQLENGGVAIATSNDPEDPGGYTRGGVALSRHPELTRVQLDAMTYADFSAFYRENYWAPNGCDHLPWPVSLVVFDGEVNQGSEGAKALQSALGVTPDGSIGAITLGAATRVNPTDLAADTCILRDSFYRGLSGFPIFGHGWLRRLYVVYAAGVSALTA